MVVRRKRGCHSGHPQAQLLASLWIIAWDAMGIPKLSLFLLLIPSSIYDNPKLENFNHTKLEQNLRDICQYKKANHYYKYCIKSIHILFLHYIYCIPTFYGKKSSKKTIESSKQAHNAKKTESVKNRTTCSNMDILNTSVTPKILKNQDNVEILYHCLNSYGKSECDKILKLLHNNLQQIFYSVVIFQNVLS